MEFWQLKFKVPVWNGACLQRKVTLSLGVLFWQVSLYKIVYKAQHPVKYFHLREESKIPVFRAMMLLLGG